ncbi:hypothetical protein [Aquimarina brevivitae]|uniref:Uncharacterized protein n=1 Tax=Aquimarina brevivitae TaxID=323412 RepID=A0A4Q7P1H3_9FLAO|nr:hypothetical protein [Aquimarina brevivitae]RZS93693.1 hypothetical protein EV197_2273 [Aquimarina brevivitae]
MKLIGIFSLLFFCAFSQAQELQEYGIPIPEVRSSLSNLKEIKSETNFVLTEVDLSRDLRREAFRDQFSMVLEEKPKYKTVTPNYNIAIPESNVKVYINAFNTDRLNNRTYTSGIKNNAYKDASTYSGLFCPQTGQRIF